MADEIALTIDSVKSSDASATVDLERSRLTLSVGREFPDALLKLFERMPVWLSRSR